jgi:hypothetical protein
MTLSTNDTDRKLTSIECYYAQRRYAECQVFINVMLSVVMLSAVASLRVNVRGFVNPTPDGLHPQLKLKCNNLSLMKSYL